MVLFKNNVGKTDRIIRVILGVLLIGNVFVGSQHPIGWLGVVLMLTGLAGICPLYSLLGISAGGLVGSLVTAVAGAAVLLLIVGLLKMA